MLYGTTFLSAFLNLCILLFLTLFFFFLTFSQRFLISPDFSQSPPNPYFTDSYCILKGDIGLGGGKGAGYPITFQDLQGKMTLEIETVCKKFLVFRMNGNITYVLQCFGVVLMEGVEELRNSGKGNASSAVSIYIFFNIGIRQIIYSDKLVNVEME